MERISAACAMEWSIELEKALRSKKPGKYTLLLYF
jgi:integrator complex subunit 7